MYEFTHKGAWFRWSSLDPTDKKLVSLSLLAVLPPAFLLGLVGGAHGYRAGYRLGSGGREPGHTHLDDLLAELAPAWVWLVALALATASAILWWRFSLRQDEMFNRVQNYALGCASAWTLAVAAAWWFLEQSGLVPSMSLGAMLVLASVLLYVFWFRAVARWA